jgi:hypothetical protein
MSIISARSDPLAVQKVSRRYPGALLVVLSTLYFAGAAFGGTVTVSSGSCTELFSADTFGGMLSYVSGQCSYGITAEVTYTTLVTITGGSGSGTANFLPGGLAGLDCGEFLALCDFEPYVQQFNFTYGVPTTLTSAAILGSEFPNFAYHVNPGVEVLNPDGSLNPDALATFADGPPPVAPEPVTAATFVAGLLFVFAMKGRVQNLYKTAEIDAIHEMRENALPVTCRL